VNHRQLVLVRTSYERIRVVRTLFADLFHRRLFLVAPRLELILPADPTRRDAAFLELVDMVVQRLDRLDLLLPTLAAQARSWSKRDVLDGDYVLAGKALAWTVEQVIKEPAAIVAWRDAFDFLAGVMRRAASDAKAIPPVPPPRRAVSTLPYADPPPSSRRGSVAPASQGSHFLP
jgi:hemoglobin-like flavoprotein